MLILHPEAAPERQQEIIERTRKLILDGGGSVEHVNEWGRRKIAYPIGKSDDGVYVVVTCTTSGEVLDELSRIYAISKDIVLRAVPIRLTPSQAERARANGAPAPVDDRPDEPRPSRPGRGGRRRG